MNLIMSPVKYSKSRWMFLGLLSCFASIISVASATSDDTVGLTSNLSMQEFFFIFIVGLVYLYFFIFVLRRLFWSQRSERLGSAIFSGLGTFLAFLAIIVGSIFIIISILVLFAVVVHVTTFEWLVTILVYYTTSLTSGILVVGAIGGVLFLLGIFLFTIARGNPLSGSQGSSPMSRDRTLLTDPGSDTKLEPSQSTIALKVFNKDHDEPAPDVKVVFKQINGIRFYAKFTDFHGEVIFKDIRGYGTEYYAYVDGDDRRRMYRVIRKKSYGETGC